MNTIEVAENDPRLVVCHQHYFSEISERFGVEFDPQAGERKGTDRTRQWNVLVFNNDKVVGCGSLRDLGEGIAEVKRVWVSQQARGLGAAGSIMNRLEEKASDEGFSAVRLDTNRTLVEARSLYLKRGYSEIDRYNDNPFADHFFEKRL